MSALYKIICISDILWWKCEIFLSVEPSTHVTEIWQFCVMSYPTPNAQKLHIWDQSTKIKSKSSWQWCFNDVAHIYLSLSNVLFLLITCISEVGSAFTKVKFQNYETYNKWYMNQPCGTHILLCLWLLTWARNIMGNFSPLEVSEWTNIQWKKWKWVTLSHLRMPSPKRGKKNFHTSVQEINSLIAYPSNPTTLCMQKKSREKRSSFLYQMSQTNTSSNIMILSTQILNNYYKKN